MTMYDVRRFLTSDPELLSVGITGRALCLRRHLTRAIKKDRIKRTQ